MNNLTEKERRALRELVEGLKELYGDNFSPQPPLLARCFAMFLLPNRIHPESAENQTNNEYYKGKNCELVHFCSSLLLNKMPNIKSVTKMIMPSKNAIFVILSGVAILPITNAIKSAWHKLRKILANSFRWFLSGFISNIVQQINMFINISDLKLRDSIKL